MEELIFKRQQFSNIPSIKMLKIKYSPIAFTSMNIDPIRHGLEVVTEYWFNYWPSIHLAKWFCTSQSWVGLHCPRVQGLTHLLFWQACLAGHSLLLLHPTPESVMVNIQNQVKVYICNISEAKHCYTDILNVECKMLILISCSPGLMD